MLSVPHRSLMFLSFHGNRAKEMYCKGTGQHLYGRCGLCGLCAYMRVCLHSSAHDAMYVAVNYCEAPRCAPCWGGMLHSKCLGIRNITQPRAKYMPLPWQTTVSTDLKQCQQTGAPKNCCENGFSTGFLPFFIYTPGLTVLSHVPDNLKHFFKWTSESCEVFH